MARKRSYVLPLPRSKFWVHKLLFAKSYKRKPEHPRMKLHKKIMAKADRQRWFIALRGLNLMRRNVKNGVPTIVLE